MSKEVFSKKISEIMYKKIKTVEECDYECFIENDEYFQLALCLSYMTLTKEKIIEKDMENTDRMARLSKKVSQAEIDKVFAPGFAANMPIIKSARENNNLWILDNIRDSIMHGMFDIDEESKSFIINNTQFDRELEVTIPFSWFVAYAKNDILNEKRVDKYTIKGIYYNKNKKNKKHFFTTKEIKNHIFYTVNVYGNNFNIKEIEDRIKELFEVYSKENITTEEMNSYTNRMRKHRSRFNDYYLASFIRAKDKVVDTIGKEFPEVSLRIYIDNRKHKLLNRAKNRLETHYSNYDVIYDILNKTVSPKSLSLLEYLYNIIEEVGNIPDHNLTKEERIRLFNKLLGGTNVEGIKALSTIYDENISILRSLCINVFGLTTLVINHETLYNNFYKNYDPRNFGIRATSKDKTVEFGKKFRSLLSDLLEAEIKLFIKQKQLDKCKTETQRKKVEPMVNDIELVVDRLTMDLIHIFGDLRYRGFCPEKNEKKLAKIHDQESWFKNWLIVNYKNLEAATTEKGKRKVKRLILKKVDEQIKIASHNYYGYCDNMQEVLTIIRNSFSHIGRVNISRNNGINTMVALNDYDNNNERTGVVFLRYIDLIELLTIPVEYLDVDEAKKLVKEN